MSANDLNLSGGGVDQTHFKYFTPAPLAKKTSRMSTSSRCTDLINTLLDVIKRLWNSKNLILGLFFILLVRISFFLSDQVFCQLGLSPLGLYSIRSFELCKEYKLRPYARIEQQIDTPCSLLQSLSRPWRALV